ncbi:MAG: hypothetical protein HY075_00155 [Deltaproteobacteria bacterium]|nr:hypothetical protein [Deltaproteobacteria bacterium]
MRLLLYLIVAMGIFYGGYRASQLREENSRLAAERDAARQALSEAGRHGGERGAPRGNTDDLRSQVEAQRKKVAELDALVSNADAKKSGGASAQLRSEIAYEREAVSDLEERLARYRSAIGSGAATLKQLKRDDGERRRAAQSELSQAIRAQQATMAELRRKLRDRRQLRLSMDEIVDAQARYDAAQAEFERLRDESGKLRAAAPDDGRREEQAADTLNRTRAEGKELERALADERKRLKDLELERKREDQLSDASFGERDKLVNRLQAERVKLEKLEERLAR